MLILIDNGHGSNTPGKCSPDGRFKEYRYTREIASAVVQELQLAGYQSQLLVPETYDVCLSARVERVNTWCHELGKKNVCLISLHVNAAGSDGRWHTARGWSCFTSKGQTAGDRLANCLYEQAKIHFPGHPIRTDYTDGDPDLEENFTLLAKTQCAAVLVEAFFMDNPEDLAFLESPEGKEKNVQTVVKGVINYASDSHYSIKNTTFV